MRSTAKYGIVVPNSSTDPDDVPTHLGNAADQIDAALGSYGGSLASRPAAGINGRLYFVNTGGTGLGILWRDNGTTWDQVNFGAGVAGDLTTIGWGDSPALGTPSKGYAPSDHRHGSQANPVVAHVSASDPHPQYDLLNTGWITSGLTFSIAGGWTITSYSFLRIGNNVMCNIYLAGAPVSSGASGNIGNLNIIRVQDTRFQPRFAVGLPTGSTGPLAGWTMDSGGLVTLNSLPPSQSFASGSPFSIAGTYIA